MKLLDTVNEQKVSKKREREDKAITDEPATKRPKLDTEDNKSAVYQSLFARNEKATSAVIQNGDFMTRCAKWGLQ
jgi:hypothetical protein